MPVIAQTSSSSFITDVVAMPPCTTGNCRCMRLACFNKVSFCYRTMMLAQKLARGRPVSGAASPAHYLNSRQLLTSILFNSHGSTLKLPDDSKARALRVHGSNARQQQRHVGCSSATAIAEQGPQSLVHQGKNIIQVLRERGLVQEVTSDDLEASAASTSLSVYCGFDPTADSLHLGNLLGIIVLSWFQKCGHTPVALLGGATGALAGGGMASGCRGKPTGCLSL